MHTLKQSHDQMALNMCTCGKLQFRYGSVTLHFEQDEFTAFANAVARLHTHYKEIQARQPFNPTPSLQSDRCH